MAVVPHASKYHKEPSRIRNDNLCKWCRYWNKFVLWNVGRWCRRPWLFAFRPSSNCIKLKSVKNFEIFAIRKLHLQKLIRHFQSRRSPHAMRADITNYWWHNTSHCVDEREWRHSCLDDATSAPRMRRAVNNGDREHVHGISTDRHSSGRKSTADIQNTRTSIFWLWCILCQALWSSATVW